MPSGELKVEDRLGNLAIHDLDEKQIAGDFVDQRTPTHLVSMAQNVKQQSAYLRGHELRKHYLKNPNQAPVKQDSAIR